MSEHQEGAAVQQPSFMAPQAGESKSAESASEPVRKKRKYTKRSATPIGRPDGREAYVSIHKTSLFNHEGQRVPSGGTIWLTGEEAAKLGQRVVKR